MFPVLFAHKITWNSPRDHFKKVDPLNISKGPLPFQSNSVKYWISKSLHWGEVSQRKV